MVKPSPALLARVRFTTKDVARGFYRGNRTGSIGAHTEYGKYVVDWRKTPHYNVPDLTGFTLSPFVTQAMPPTPYTEDAPDGTIYTPEKGDGVEFLRSWRKANSAEYEHIYQYQYDQQSQAEAPSSNEQEPTLEEPQPSIVEQELSAEAPRIEVEPPQKRSISRKTTDFQDVQRREYHTTSRRLNTSREQTQPEPSSTTPHADEISEPRHAGWLGMSRVERKALVNTATVTALRIARKAKAKPTQQDKKAIKKGIKTRLRDELIGEGILENEKEFDKLMTDEGRNRKRAGLPFNKSEFLFEVVQKSGRAPSEVVKQILAEMIRKENSPDETVPVKA